MTNNNKMGNTMVDNETIELMYKELYPTLSENSYKTMKSNFNRLKKIFKVKNLQDIYYDGHLDDLNEAINTIKEFGSLNTAIQTILGLQRVIQIIDIENEEEDHSENLNKITPDLAKYLKICCDRNKEIINENKLTAKDRENWINYSSLVQGFKSHIRNRVNKEGGNAVNHFIKVRNEMITALYILIPPTRITNYEKMFIKMFHTDDPILPQDKNWLLINDKEYYVVFSKYKTAKILGDVYKKIGNTPNEAFLKSMLKHYLAVRNELFESVNMGHLEPLFITQEASPIPQAKYTDILKRTTKNIFDKEISVDLFRKIFITNYMKGEHTITENTETAKFMGQTYNATMMEKYRKIQTPDDKGGVVLGFD